MVGRGITGMYRGGGCPPSNIHRLTTHPSSSQTVSLLYPFHTEDDPSLWLNSKSTPAWVREELAKVDSQKASFAPY